MYEGITLENWNYDPRWKRVVLYTTAESFG